MRKFIIFKWIGKWVVYIPNANRDSVPMFDTAGEADSWLSAYITTWDGPMSDDDLRAEKERYFIMQIPTPD